MKVNKLLLSLFKKSNPEQIALYHIGTVSESLSSLIKNERHEWFAHESSILLSKTSHLLKLILIFLYVSDSFSLFFPFFMPKSESHQLLFAQLLFLKEQQEGFALVALYKRATVSKLLFCSFAHKNERFANKTK